MDVSGELERLESLYAELLQAYATTSGVAGRQLAGIKRAVQTLVDSVERTGRASCPCCGQPLAKVEAPVRVQDCAQTSTAVLHFSSTDSMDAFMLQHGLRQERK